MEAVDRTAMCRTLYPVLVAPPAPTSAPCATSSPPRPRATPSRPTSTATSRSAAWPPRPRPSWCCAPCRRAGPPTRWAPSSPPRPNDRPAPSEKHPPPPAPRCRSGRAPAGGPFHQSGTAMNDVVTAATELLATCWTTAGDAAPSREDWRSPVPLRERIDAAAAAGFTGFGVLAVDVAVAEREHGWSGIRAMLADNGIVHLDLEGLPDWWSGGPERARSDELRRFLLTAAEALGARPPQVTPDTSGAPWGTDPRAGGVALLPGPAGGARGRPRIWVPPPAHIPAPPPG